MSDNVVRVFTRARSRAQRVVQNGALTILNMTQRFADSINESVSISPSDSPFSKGHVGNTTAQDDETIKTPICLSDVIVTYTPAPSTPKIVRSQNITDVKLHTKISCPNDGLFNVSIPDTASAEWDSQFDLRSVYIPDTAYQIASKVVMEPSAMFQPDIEPDGDLQSMLQEQLPLTASAPAEQQIEADLHNPKEYTVLTEHPDSTFMETQTNLPERPDETDIPGGDHTTGSLLDPLELGEVQQAANLVHDPTQDNPQNELIQPDAIRHVEATQPVEVDLDEIQPAPTQMPTVQPAGTMPKHVTPQSELYVKTQEMPLQLVQQFQQLAEKFKVREKQLLDLEKQLQIQKQQLEMEQQIFLKQQKTQQTQQPQNKQPVQQQIQSPSTPQVQQQTQQLQDWFLQQMQVQQAQINQQAQQTQLVIQTQLKTLEQRLETRDDEFRALERQVQQQTVPPKCSVQQQQSAQEQQQDASSVVQGLSILLSTRLPLVDIEKFNGDYSDYEGFKTKFKTLINSTNATSEDQARTLYQALGSGVVLQLEHVPDLRSAGAYEKIWQSLDEEFGRFQKGAISYVTDLSIKLQTWPQCKTSSELQQLYKFVQYYYTALEETGQESEAEHTSIRMLLLGRLTDRVASRCSSLIEEKPNQPVLKEMLDFMKKEIRNLSLQELSRGQEINPTTTKRTPCKSNLVNNMEKDTSLPVPVNYVNTRPLKMDHRTVHNNPPSVLKSPRQGYGGGDRRSQTRQGQPNLPDDSPCIKEMEKRLSRKCIFCISDDHESDKCTSLGSPEEYKMLLYQFRFCYNCHDQGHRAYQCFKPKSCTKGCRDSYKHSTVTCKHRN